MKNIHLKITEKPSRLTYNLLNQLIILTKDSCRVNYGNEVNQHIYITSDEEIKVGDWCYDKLLNFMFKTDNYTNFNYVNQSDNVYKIILTTDQELNGVQAIDDSFLEWFVKNPSCEEVEVQKRYSDFTVEPFIGYKIIIPQEEINFFQITVNAFEKSMNLNLEYIEEPKQELLPDFKITKNIFDFVTDLSDTNKEEPKQETLEEAAKRTYQKGLQDDIDLSFYDGVRLGANYQAERMYSEEEVEKIFKQAQLCAVKSDGVYFKYETFEQFKKK
jgi:hypothetical protein